MNYGQAQALKVLAAERLGLDPADTETAHKMLSGKPVHVMHSVRVSAEATRMHNLIRGDAGKVQAANEHVAALQREFGLVG